MQAADYRHVDVSGITIADKILPKTDGQDGGARPDRAEDFAFLYEAINERGRAASPSTADLVRCTISGVLIGGIRGVTHEPQQVISGGDYWCDLNATGAIRDEEITGRSFDPLVLWPGIFPGVVTQAAGFGRPNAIDDVRKMYRDLKRHEGYLAIDEGVTGGGTLSFVTTSPYKNNYDEEIDAMYYRYMQLTDDDGYVDFYTTTYTSFGLSSPEPDIELSTSGGILVLDVEVMGRERQGDTVSTKHFVKTFRNPTLAEINGDWHLDCRSAAGFSSSSRYVDVNVVDYMVVLPFEGRTKLRNLAWNWEPS